MTWEDLTKDNIEEIKELYIEYLQENKNNEYKANLLTFEEFIEKKLTKCTRCDNILYEGEGKGTGDYEKLCECCYDDLYTI